MDRKALRMYQCTLYKHCECINVPSNKHCECINVPSTSSAIYIKKQQVNHVLVLSRWIDKRIEEVGTVKWNISNLSSVWKGICHIILLYKFPGNTTYHTEVMHHRDPAQTRLKHTVSATGYVVCKHKPWSVVKVSLHYKTTIGHVLKLLLTLTQPVGSWARLLSRHNDLLIKCQIRVCACRLQDMHGGMSGLLQAGNGQLVQYPGQCLTVLETQFTERGEWGITAREREGHEKGFLKRGRGDKEREREGR